MKKKLFLSLLLVLGLSFAVGCNKTPASSSSEAPASSGSSQAPASSSSSQAPASSSSSQTPASSSSSQAPAATYLSAYDFTTSTHTSNGKDLDTAGVKTLFTDSYKAGTAAASVVTDVTTATKVYDGNGSGGAYPNTAQLIKLGTGSVDAELVLTVSENVGYVVIKCHDWYTASDSYPTGSNKLEVNGTEKAFPYTSGPTATAVEFEFTASTTITIKTSNSTSTESKVVGGRGFLLSIEFYTSKPAA